MLASEAVVPAWKPAVVLGTAALMLRLSALLCHLIALRARRVARTVSFAAAGVLLLTAFGGEPVAGLRGEPLIRRWALVATDPQAVAASWVLIPALTAGALGCLTLYVARGYVEAADDRARQNAELQEAIRRDSTGMESGTQWFHSGFASLPGPDRWTGEAALLFRGLAQQRRMLLAVGLEFTVEFLATIALLALAHHLAWIPLAFVLTAAIVTSPFTGIAMDIDHNHVWVAPVRPLRALLAATAVPAVTIALSAELLWLTLGIGDVFTAGVWLAGAVVLPLVAVVILLGGALGLALGGAGLLRIPLAFGFAAAGVAPLGALLVMPGPLGLAGAASLLLGLGAVAASVASRRLWPSRLA